MKNIEYNTIKIHYRISGNGNPIVFLHGFLENHSMWNTIATKVEALGYKVILIDLPCHGKTRFIGEICSMQFMAKAVEAVLITEKIVNPFVFGHSMGGYVGLELLKLMPIKLTLVHSNFWNDSIEKQKDRNRVAKIVKKNKLRLINEAIPNLFAKINQKQCLPIIDQLITEAKQIPASEIIASTFGMRDRVDNSNLIESQAINIIQGDLDTVVKLNVLKDKLNELKGKTPLLLIENCGHMSIWEKTDVLISHLKLVLIK